MYIRVSKTKNAKNLKTYTKYQLVKSIRIDGKPTNQILLILGGLEEFSDEQIKILEKRMVDIYYNQKVLPLDGVFDKQIEKIAQYFVKRLLNKNFAEKKMKFGMQTHLVPEYKEVDINSFTSDSCLQIGGEYLCFQAFEELGLENFLRNDLQCDELQTKQALIALLGRLLFPGSELSNQMWINEHSGILEFYPLPTGQINRNQLHQSALLLYDNRFTLQKHINQRIMDLFNLPNKILLYDLTNFHFEGQMSKAPLCKRGRNKQKRNDCKQITLGMVVDQWGYCRYSNYHQGNIAEVKTLETMLEQMRSATVGGCGERQCVIMDAGIASEENLELMLKNDYDYIVVSRKKHNDLRKEIDPTKLKTFTNKSGQQLKAQLLAGKIQYTDKEGNPQSREEQFVYIQTPDKYLKEKSIDENKCKRFAQGLESIQKTVQNTRGQNSIQQIHQRLGRLKEKYKGITGYFEIRLQHNDKQITHFEYEQKNFEKKKKNWAPILYVLH